jgi:adenylyl-sulfate kinase
MMAARTANLAEVAKSNGRLPAGAPRRARWSALGSRGLTVWVTGLPASGKSTIAAGVEGRLVHAGRPVCWLDGDRLRAGLNRDLGFDAASRAESVRRAAEVARLAADSHRARARALHERDGLTFLEVWLSTPLAECERRDPKGLYARARCGELRGMTGIDDPYEPPTAPDLELGHGLCVEDCVASVVGLIDAAGTGTAGAGPAVPLADGQAGAR